MTIIAQTRGRTVEIFASGLGLQVGLKEIFEYSPCFLGA